jgi:hypothetical protein
MGQYKKIILISLIFGAISVALIVFVAYPLLKGIRSDSGSIVEMKKSLASSQDQTGSISQIRKIYGEVEPDIVKVNNFFIDPGVPIDLIKFWEKTAEGVGVSISISPLALKKDDSDPWSTMGFQISANGSFSSFLRFLEKIENAPYLSEIQNMNIRRFTAAELVIQNYENISLGDINAMFVVKVFTR